MARIHRRTIQKDLHDPDNHDGVITNLEPNILECEVKWAFRKHHNAENQVEHLEVHSSHIDEAWQLCGSLSILWHCLSLGLE